MLARAQRQVTDCGMGTLPLLDPQGFERAYNLILENAGKAILAIFARLDDPNPGPILMHCSAGKDRTGVIAMVILSLAGCSPEIVAREYSLTQVGLGEVWRAEAASRLATYEAFRDQDRSGIKRMVSAREDVMLAVIQNLDREYGGVEGYLAAIGVDKARVNRVKEVLQENERHDVTRN